MQQQSLFIDGPAGQLQAIYQQGKKDCPAVVLCHPHPLYGGTMRNKVVYWMARAFGDAGCSTLRFNFRGVERSEGVWDNGKGETDDASAALAFLQHKHPDAPLWLAGFSFGCYAGLQAASNHPSVAHMIAVAPAVHMHDFSFMATRSNHAPCMVIAAEEDEIVPFNELQAWASQCPNIDWHSIAGAGHFFPQYDSVLQALLRGLLTDVTPLFMNRTQPIHQWLHTIKQDDYQLSPLAGDASFRRYLRLCNNKGDTYILMDAPPPHEDVRPFIEVGSLLYQAGLRTPCIIAKNVSEGFLLLEDFGDTTWAAALQQGQAVEPLFADALKQLSKLQVINTDQGLPHFDAHRMRRECALWTDWYLPHAIGTRLRPALRDTLLDELTTLFLPLLSLPKGVVHLDFHSRNLMLPSEGLPLGVIDFQDAVVGSVCYDIASLLYDCYQDYPETERQYWSHVFFHQLPSAQQQYFSDANHWHQMVRLTAMQRHLKAMGIFTRLAIRDGKQQFLNEIPLTFKHLQQEMEVIKLPKHYAISSFLTTHINHESGTPCT